MPRRVPLLAALSLPVVAAPVLAAGMLTAAPTAALAADCPQVAVAFARGSGESPGLGITGTPFVNSLKADLPGVSVYTYAVNYAADIFQTSATQGSQDLTNFLVNGAQQCPKTRFVLGGYSQGATVVDKAIGITTGIGGATVIPQQYATKVAAIAVFGNPLGLQGQTIAKASPTYYGPRSKDYCNSGDPVCGNGVNILAHLQYGSNGSTTDAAQLAANILKAGG